MRPADLRYSKTHEWVRVEKDIATEWGTAKDKEKNVRTKFVHFLQGILRMDPKERWTPFQVRFRFLVFLSFLFIFCSGWLRGWLGGWLGCLPF